MALSLTSDDLAQFDRMIGRANPLCPNILHPKQREFLALTALEVLYGGAAGGGKSEALLAGALQYAHVPGYKSLVLRRTIAALQLPEALMDRANDWLTGTAAVWEPMRRRWRIPTRGKPSILQFGYCESQSDLQRYKSAAFQNITTDELTEWPEPWYRFLFSRLRRPKWMTWVPLAMRAATNPDGPFADWVRERFEIPLDEIVEAPIVSNGGKRIFFPARAEDNPALDLDAYDESLKELGEDAYEQLRWGRWRRNSEGTIYKYSEENIVDDVPSDITEYVCGIDYGYTNACAWVVLGFRQGDPNVYVVFVCKREKQIPSEAAEFTLQLETTYKFSRIVGDFSGLGKGYGTEAQTRFGVPVEAADKNNKVGYQLLFNGDLARKRIVLLRSACGPLIEEWKKIQRKADSPEEIVSKRTPNHLADAALYGWRACYAYRVTAIKPKVDASNRADEEAKEAFRRRMAMNRRGSTSSLF